MSFEELENLAIAYLMGELNDEERTAFEQRMARDEEVADLVDELEQSMGLAMMAEADFVEPDGGLRERLLDAIPDEETGNPTDESQETVTRFPVWKVTLGVIGWAVAACLAVIYLNHRGLVEDLRVEKSSIEVVNQELETKIEGLSEQVTTTLARNVELENRMTTAQADYEALQERLDQLSIQLADTDSERKNLEETVARLRQISVLDKVQIAALNSEVDDLRYGFAVWDNEADRGIAKVFNLQAINPSQDYQFWVISPDQEAPIPAGVFQVDSQGRADYAFAPSVSVSSAGAFAISLEPKGGSLSPTGPIVLSGAL